ncbi:hypothetical protein BDW42DRAFT_152837 [Aspergillus taichungensis]|uniref:Uncharacterized protein n=1 Tax=Aspergillus taichungensis TaxID=482145 RepID=A0A2J5HLG2_9EURO|nr:hypothetical protein BDW42DRAFT_152837 [Aspergillus taichungensis]
MRIEYSRPSEPTGGLDGLAGLGFYFLAWSNFYPSFPIHTNPTFHGPSSVTTGFLICCLALLDQLSPSMITSYASQSVFHLSLILFVLLLLGYLGPLYFLDISTLSNTFNHPYPPSDRLDCGDVRLHRKPSIHSLTCHKPPVFPVEIRSLSF